MGSNRIFSKVSKKAFSWLLSAVLLSSCFSSMPVKCCQGRANGRGVISGR